MKKKLLAIALTAVMALSLAACGGGGDKPADTSAEATTAAAEETTAAESKAGEAKAPAGDGVADDLGEVKAAKAYKFGLSMPVRDQWQSEFEAANKAEAEDQGAELTVVDANNNMNTQIQNVQTFASQGCDAIIVGLVNTDSAQQVLDAANGIPVVFANRRPSIELEKGKATYVGSDERYAGQLQGEFLVKYFEEKGITEPKIVMLQGVLGLESVQNRTAGAKEALDKAGLKYEIVYEDTAEWDRAKAQNKIQTFLGTGKDFDCIISNNDEMALGAIEALKGAGKNPADTPVLGIDATEQGLTALEAGDLAFTVFQNAEGQGRGSVRSAVKFANGEDMGTLVDIAFEPVDSSNFQDYK